VLQAFVEGHVILVTEGGKPVGILTKIDLLDFMTQEAQV
jgi:predicted transcriptional regulator